MGAVGCGGEDLARLEEAAPMAGGGGEKVERIFVSVRVRPLNEKELAARDNCDWECINDTTIIFRNNMPERSMPPTAYTFDRVFGSDCPTKRVYEEGAKEVSLSVVSGINSTIFAYGQTSSGKTYTMTGITEYTVGDIYDYIHMHEERAFVLKFSAIEIYNEAVKDLLSSDSTPLRLLDDPEKGTIVEKLTEETLRDWNHLKALISICEAQRKIGETSLNETSSRSHQILRLTVQSSALEFLGKDNSSTLMASVNFVDLAGSERASQANSAGTRLKEGCHINRSLLTLGTVIRKLSKGRNGHIPFRDSKLTRILQPSLGGNARTAIICTMSPARTHFEQSRNTLLFASCAKEVETNAQVNVVMSDKALVKHLQKELARLESELRYPGLSPNVEALLKEKDDQIKKMGKEMEELIQQRDLANSHLEILLQAADLDNVSRQSEESSQISTPIVPCACEDMLSSSEPSDIVDLSPDSVSSKFVQQYLPRNSKAIHSQKHPISSPTHFGLSGNISEQEFDRGLDGDYEDPCEVVKFIEMHEVCKSADLVSTSTEKGNSFYNLNIEAESRNQKHRPEGRMRWELLSNKTMTLEEHLQEVRKKFSNMLIDYSDDSSPVSSAQNLSASRGLVLKRSRSSRSSMMSISSLSQEVDQNGGTPPDQFVQYFPGRPAISQRKRFAVNHDAETKLLQGEGSLCSKNSTASSDRQPQEREVGPEWEMTDIHDYVAELKQMTHGHEKQLFAGQETDWKVDEETGVNETAKVYGLDPTLYPLQSPYHWLQEFKKKQLEIIELWHECNVSLVHRTYFFILFKGEPTDSIYMEVELRRLSFLKISLSREILDKTATLHQNSTSESSIKKLRREREMLCRQMHKRLSLEDREKLYVKWRITLNSKQRRLQLARLIWTETKDLEHVKESASLVAQLIGIEEQGQALKEMFGLSFTRQEPSRRFLSWRNG